MPKKLFNDQRLYSILTPLNYRKRFCIGYKFDHFVSSYLVNVFNYIFKTGFQEKFDLNWQVFTLLLMTAGSKFQKFNCDNFVLETTHGVLQWYVLNKKLNQVRWNQLKQDIPNLILITKIYI